MGSAWDNAPLPGRHPWTSRPGTHRQVVALLALGALACPSDARETPGRQRKVEGGWALPAGFASGCR